MEHHAYIYEGSLKNFEALKERTRPLTAEVYERFGIDEARALIERAMLKNFADTTFLLAAASMTTEAQQALLKLFEEPQPGTTFVLLVPHGIVLPTLRSRMMEYPEKLKLSGQKSSAAPRLFVQPVLVFLGGSQKDRSDFIAKLLKDDEGVKERTREFLDGLEVELHKKIKDPAARAGLEDIAMARDYLRDRSPSLKMLLEHLAVSLPTV